MRERGNPRPVLVSQYSLKKFVELSRDKFAPPKTPKPDKKPDKPAPPKP